MPYLKNSAVFGAILLCAFATTNAQSQYPIRANQEAAIQSERPQLNTVNIIDKNLQTTHVYKNGNTVTTGKLAIEGAGQDVLDTGRRQVWVQLRNLTDFSQNILVRTTWYSESGRPVDGPNAWTRISLSQNAGEIYESSSISRKSRAFMVEVQEVR